MRRALPSLPLLAVLLACSPGSSTQTRADLRQAAPGDICSSLMASPPSRDVPAVPVTGPVRFFAFGDFGYGTAGQGKVAHAMADVHQRRPFHFGVTLGDNFYPDGLDSPIHPRWRTEWEEMYGGLGIRVYATLGNHDYHVPASPAAEQARSRLSRSWCLPRPFYTFTAGPVQLFALDTVPIEKGGGTVREQLAWLDGALAASRAPWKVVYGHHPVYTNGSHGGAGGVLPMIRDALLPILKKHRVDVYLAGHDHDLEALEPDGGVHFLISGGGGRDLRRLKSGRCRAWAESRFGFLGLEADERTLTATFFGDLGQTVHEMRLRKGETVADCRR
jgi:tartrate-resistant acid phosphatase type 5